MGKANGALEGNLHLRAPQGTPMANVFVDLMQRMGHDLESFGDSTAAFSLTHPKTSTTPEGIHLGAMAGSLDLLQRCYSGLELHDGALWFEPRLPPDVKTLAFDLLHRDRNLAVEITHDSFRLEVEPGARNPVSVAVRGELQVLAPGEVLEVDLT